MALMSICCDYMMWNLAEKLKSSPERVTHLFASSYIALVFYTRTLSNSIESFLFILLLYAVSDTVNTPNGNDRGKPLAVIRRKMLAHGAEGISAENYFIVALIIVVGIFNRPTFIVFAIVPYYYWLFNVVPMRYYVTHVAERLFYSGMCAISISSIYIIIESFYYGSCFFHLDPNFTGFTAFLRQLTITPLNFLLYNTDSKNLAEHGIHPRFTHAIFNCPLLFGILGILALLEIIRLLVKIVLRRYVDMDKGRLFLLQCFVIPLVFLSIFPHQEPRFLIPLLAPLSILYAEKVCNSCPLYSMWIISNLFLALLFGALHQGGVVPSIFHLGQTLNSVDASASLTHSHIIFFHTYMPPRHLLAIDVSKSITVHDLKGSQVSDIKRLFDDINSRLNFSNSNIYLVTPQTVGNTLCHELNWTSVNLISRFWPHISMEDPPDVLASFHHSTDSCFISKQAEISPYLAQFSLLILQLQTLQ